MEGEDEGGGLVGLVGWREVEQESAEAAGCGAVDGERGGGAGGLWVRGVVVAAAAAAGVAVGGGVDGEGEGECEVDDREHFRGVFFEGRPGKSRF